MDNGQSGIPETQGFEPFDVSQSYNNQNSLLFGTTQPFEISTSTDFPETQRFDRTDEYANFDAGETAEGNEDPFVSASTQPFVVAQPNEQVEGNEEEGYMSTQPFQVDNYGYSDVNQTQPFDAPNANTYEAEGEESFIQAEDNPVSPDECPASPDNEPVEGEEESTADPSKVTSDNEEDDESSVKPRKLRISSDDDDDEDANNVEKPVKNTTDDNENNEVDDQNDDQKSEVGELIADIFGESDEEAANEIGQNEEAERDNERLSDGLDDSGGLDEDSDIRKKETESDFVSDFDLMMQKRKLESKRRRRRKDYDVINDADDMINELLHQMKRAAKEDIELNSQKLPALKKRKLLPVVLKELKKSDLQSSFIEMGAVTSLAEWLSPLPDRSLPALEIRTEFLKILQQFPTFDHQVLRSSNIGKAVMILYKHPKETKENKERAGKLISEWARPIFNLQSDYRSLTKDERIKRDYDHMPLAKKRRMSSLDSENPPSQPKPNGSDEKVLGPGDKGFIIRARVPRPSTKDYVVRPKWNVETQFRKNAKKSASKLDRKIREIKERTKPKKLSHAVGVSIEGRKLAL